MSIYSAAKAAVIGFVRVVAVEAGAAGVTVNSILPGVIATETVKKKFRTSDGSIPFLDQLIERQAIKRSGQPEDIAHTICFIASPEAAFTTSQMFDIGGGVTFHYE